MNISFQEEENLQNDDAAILAAMDCSFNEEENHEGVKMDQLERETIQKETRIVLSETILGSSDMEKYFEKNLLYGLKTYFSKRIVEEDIEQHSKDLQDVLNFFLEPDETNENHGLELLFFKICLTTDQTLEAIDYGVIDENSNDFIWIGIIEMSGGQHVKIMTEGNYFVENMYY